MAWFRSHKLLGSAIGIVLAVIGLGGLPDDIVTWMGWIETSARWLSGDVGRWLVLSLGVSVVLLVNADRIPGLKSLVPQVEFVEPTPAPVALSPKPAKQSRHVMWCGIRWVWSGDMEYGDPLVVPYCPTQTEVKLLVSQNLTREIRPPDSQDWIFDGSSRHLFYCIRGIDGEDGPHTFGFHRDCETTHYGQVRERAIQLYSRRPPQGGVD